MLDSPSLLNWRQQDWPLSRQGVWAGDNEEEEEERKDLAYLDFIDGINGLAVMNENATSFELLGICCKFAHSPEIAANRMIHMHSHGGLQRLIPCKSLTLILFSRSLRGWNPSSRLSQFFCYLLFLNSRRFLSFSASWFIELSTKPFEDQTRLLPCIDIQQRKIHTSVQVYWSGLS